MENVGIAILVSVSFGALALYVWAVSWAIGDAQRRGQTGCLPMLLFYLFGPVAIPIWIVTRPRERVIDKPAEDYESADDALAAASRLDGQGDWDAAIALYEISAQRWPEHRGYVDQCLEQIKKKQKQSR